MIPPVMELGRLEYFVNILDDFPTARIWSSFCKGSVFRVRIELKDVL